jgi:hypothetical protein
MPRKRQPILVITGLATVAAVLAGFSQTFLLDAVPLQWWPYAAIALVVTLSLQLLVASAPERG